MRFQSVGLALLLVTTTAAQTTTGTKPSANPASKQSTTTKTMNWKAVHQAAIVVDTHADTPGRFVDDNFDPSTDAGRGHWDLAKAKQGNLGVEFFSIWVDPEKFKGQYVQRAMRMIDSVYETVGKHPDQMVMAYSVKDIRAARTGPKKRIASLMGLEGGHVIEGDMALLRDFYRLGVRYMTLTWANSTDWAQSSGDYKKDPASGKVLDPGLTEYGRKIVMEMNRIGMIVDISHVSDRSFYNALTASRAPVIASHSSARAITDVPRNMTDDMLIALSRNNGVAMVNTIFSTRPRSTNSSKLSGRETSRPLKSTRLRSISSPSNSARSEVCLSSSRRQTRFRSTRSNRLRASCAGLNPAR